MTALVECSNCRLRVRTPTDDVSESNEFYQDAYSQGYTTDCPSSQELDRLKRTGFAGTERDYSRFVRFFEFLGISRDKRILDFGCSWGYGLYQIRLAGYDRSEGFEVSVPRARYAKERLDVVAHTNPADVRGNYDVVFSSHVMEHLPDFSFLNSLYEQHLNPGGYFIAVTPNGSDAFKSANYASFHRLWGHVHPVLLNDAFVERSFGPGLHYMSSWDSQASEFGAVGGGNGDLDKYELVFVMKKKE